MFDGDGDGNYGDNMVTLNAGVAVLMKHPRGQRNSPHRREVAHGELRHADIVQPRGDRLGLLPVRHAPPVAHVDLLHQCPVRHHLISRRRGDQELAGGFVVGMIDHGQPLARLVGPVGAEERALAEGLRPRHVRRHAVDAVQAVVGEGGIIFRCRPAELQQVGVQAGSLVV